MILENKMVQDITISVGSAILSIFFAIGEVGLVLTKKLPQISSTWWFFFHCIFYYAICLAAATGFYHDGVLAWYELLAMFFLWILHAFISFCV